MKQWKESEFNLPTIWGSQKCAIIGIYDDGSRTYGTALLGSGSVDSSCAIVGGGGGGGEGGEGGGGGVVCGVITPLQPPSGGGGGAGSTRLSRRVMYRTRVTT